VLQIEVAGSLAADPLEYSVSLPDSQPAPAWIRIDQSGMLQTRPPAFLPYGPSPETVVRVAVVHPATGQTATRDFTVLRLEVADGPPFWQIGAGPLTALPGATAQRPVTWVNPGGYMYSMAPARLTGIGAPEDQPDVLPEWIALDLFSGVMTMSPPAGEPEQDWLVDVTVTDLFSGLAATQMMTVRVGEPFVIVNGGVIEVELGRPAQFQVQVAGARSPTVWYRFGGTWGLWPYPEFASIDLETGLVTINDPAQALGRTLTVTAVDSSGGGADTADFTFEVMANPPLRITNAGVQHNAMVGTTVAIWAETNSSRPEDLVFTGEVVNGPLPDRVIVDPDGVIWVLPFAAAKGLASVAVTVTDQVTGETDTQVFDFVPIATYSTTITNAVRDLPVAPGATAELTLEYESNAAHQWAVKWELEPVNTVQAGGVPEWIRIEDNRLVAQPAAGQESGVYAVTVVADGLWVAEPDRKVFTVTVAPDFQPELEIVGPEDFLFATPEGTSWQIDVAGAAGDAFLAYAVSAPDPTGDWPSWVQIDQSGRLTARPPAFHTPYADSAVRVTVVELPTGRVAHKDFTVRPLMIADGPPFWNSDVTPLAAPPGGAAAAGVSWIANRYGYTFSQALEPTVRVTASAGDVAGVPSWITLDAATGVIAMAPPAGEPEGDWRLAITVTDPFSGMTATAPFTVRVGEPFVIANGGAIQLAPAGNTEFQVLVAGARGPETVFVFGGTWGLQPVPHYATINRDTGLITVTDPAAALGQTVTVTARDVAGGGTAQAEFAFEPPAGPGLAIVNPVTDFYYEVGWPFEVQVLTDSDQPGGVRFSATAAGGGPLGDWIAISAAGLITVRGIGTEPCIAVTALDQATGATATREFCFQGYVVDYGTRITNTQFNLKAAQGQRAELPLLADQPPHNFQVAWSLDPAAQPAAPDWIRTEGALLVAQPPRGTPPGDYTVTVVAGGSWVYHADAKPFTVTVEAAPDPGGLVIVNREATLDAPPAGASLQVEVDGATPGAALAYTIALANGGAAPSWIKIDQSGRIAVRPPAFLKPTAYSDYPMRVGVRDPATGATATWDVTVYRVQDAAAAPFWNQAAGPLTVAPGGRASLAAVNAAPDPDYRYSLYATQGTLPGWVSADASTGVVTAAPPPGEAARDLTVYVMVTDRASGLSASSIIAIRVTG
jgi:hypothetical protein